MAEIVDEGYRRYVAELNVAVAAHEAAVDEWRQALKKRGWPEGNPFPVPVTEDDPLIDVFSRVRAAEAAVSDVFARRPEL
ncbi:hypothetical protein SAMN05661080_04811 [Modestobacter sp. DSM 44400]|uniref:hypothetical protein n=1 Tax=Modestobacter sp. DSM 44400 TaxID=1550230 RepID=UPI000897166B|nr:hypothetical protein [Modestobacter sp. DSM 44400]SDY85209.1 hypothetical protein SAMN05661080_04811 [Modestobacter sp. DSM 44400]